MGRWFSKNREHFPFGGDRVAVYFHRLDYEGGEGSDLERVEALVQELRNQARSARFEF